MTLNWLKSIILKKRDSRPDGQLDRVARQILHASAMNEGEAEAAASSPYLYARLQSRINDERIRRKEGEQHWFALRGVFPRAVLAMALLVVFAFGLLLAVSRSTSQAPGGLSDELLLGARDAGVEHVVFADRQPLSGDEVLSTIMSGEDREATR